MELEYTGADGGKTTHPSTASPNSELSSKAKLSYNPNLNYGAKEVRSRKVEMYELHSFTNLCKARLP